MSQEIFDYGRQLAAERSINSELGVRVERGAALRAEATLAHTAVIMVTARDTESDLEWGYACGADDYVVKPFLTSDLVHRVERAIAHRAAIIGTGQPTG